MRIGIVQFPGSNCERETSMAVKRAGMEPVNFLWNEDKQKLLSLDGYVIVGGFAYEDRSRAGIIAAHDPIMQVISAESAKGKPVLGICNGAQILIESGLVPGTENNKVSMALAENKRVANGKILGTGFYNDWVYIRLSAEYQRNAFTRHLHHNSILKVPIAHAEGRFVISAALLAEIKAQGLHVFQYCDAQGTIDPHFPTNPNASIENIAAVANKAGNILAIMPHPERTIAGDPIFESIRDYIAEGQYQAVSPLTYYPRRFSLPRYQKVAGTTEWVTELRITDNEALTVENVLRQNGLKVHVRKQVHWELTCDSIQTLDAIEKTGVLYNPNKEIKTHAHPAQKAGQRFLVRTKENINGKAKQQLLKYHYNIQGVSEIKAGLLWHFEWEKDMMGPGGDEILKTNIIANPYAHECYQYT